MAFPREKKPPKQQYHCKLCHSVISCPRPSGFCQNCLRKTPEGRKYLSEHVKGSGAGGYHGNAYGGIKGSYLGIHCDSTWELVYLIYQLDHGVQVSRNKDVFLYVYNGEVRKYYPDFKEGDTYIEIKGREWPNWKYKLEQFPKNKKLKVLYRKDIAPYLDYVKSKYGSNLAMLYDQPKAIDYTKYHWYTNTITKEIKFSNVKLEYPYVLGRV